MSYQADRHSFLEEAFHPYLNWVRTLLPLVEAHDPCHDTAHLARVFAHGRAIMDVEGGDMEALAVAVLLHDSVHVEKDSPVRAQASRMAAAHARAVLDGKMPTASVDDVAHAIEAHSFSAGIEPRTHLARVLQDADRLDAIGALGVARCFFTAGRIGRLLYDPEDPRATRRPLDDIAFSTDHFRTKILTVGAGFRTTTGSEMARIRTERAARFLHEFEEEIGLDPEEPGYIREAAPGGP